MNDIVTLFHAAIDAIKRTGEDALLIGGLAVNHYGFSRATADIDFMMASADDDSVRREMVVAGFSDVDARDNVTYFQKPGTAIRVDVLNVDRATMRKLVDRAITVRFHDREIKVPELKDLLAMKLFAMKNSGNRRMHKDLPDIAYLVKRHHLDVVNVLKPLAMEFADEDIFRKVVEFMGDDR